jgi:hypothetical protein
MHVRRCIITFALCLLAVSGWAGGKILKQPEIDLATLDLKDGDIVFQHWLGKLGSVIADVTDSPLSHCGMVVHRKGEPWVIEAVGPVRYISFKKWLRQGDRGYFMQMRVKEASERQIANAIEVAESMLGRPYDIQYELDDEKIYCSELVYKAYERGAEIEVGDKEALRDLKWRPHEKFIRVLAGGELPLDRVMVTPVSIARHSRLKLMYSTFPARKAEPLYDATALAGKWSGEYTIKDLDPVAAKLEFDEQGKFVAGTIHPPDDAKIVIRRLNVESFHAQREFTARLRDGRGINGRIEARICDEGRRIIGEWRDDQGYLGVFSLGRETEDGD